MLLEFFNVTTGQDNSIVTTLSLDGAVSDVQFSMNSSTLENYRAPIIIDSYYLTGTTNYPTFFLKEQGIYVQSNHNWTTDADYPLISGVNILTGSHNYSAFYDKIRPSYSYELGFSGLAAFPANPNPLHVHFHRLFGQPYDLESGFHSPTNAWVSYDVNSGVNTKTVFAYSLSLLKQISGQNSTNLNPQGLAPVLYGMAPQANSGYCSAFSLVFGNSGSCVSQTGETLNQVCLTGVVTSGVLQSAINQALIAAGLLSGNGDTTPPTENDFSNNSVGTAYSIYTGGFIYNQPVTGDKLCFDSYSFDYADTYSGIYGTTPPYPATSGCWVYGTDYHSIDGLVSGINAFLSGQSYELWYQNYTCTANQTQGYFEYSPLLVASKTDSNTIFFQSTRVGTAGNYLFQFTPAPRPYQDQNNLIKYLLPATVSLQGANTYGAWNTIDSHSGIDWTLLTPTLVQDSIPNNIGSGNPPPKKPDAPTGSVPNASGDPAIQVVYTLTVTGLDKCQNPFTNVTQFYTIPSQSGCQTSGDDNNQDQGDLSNLVDNALAAGASGSPVVSSYLKTGWKFNNYSGYNYYRVVLDNFSADTQGYQPYFANEFYIKNINLYGTVTGFDTYSGNMCLIGANYSLSVQGFATGIISGMASGHANSGTSGEYNFINVAVTGIPNNGGLVRFQNYSGKPVQPFTGLLNANLVGTGFYSGQVQGYFYNSGSLTISYDEPVSGYIAGSGRLTGGPYNIVNPLALAGISSHQYVYSTQTFIAGGVIPNYTVDAGGLAGFGYLSGTLSGMVTTGGSFIFNQNLNAIPTITYQTLPSGYVNSTAILNYRSPQESDKVFINGFTTRFTQNTGFSAPTFFKSIGDLVNIINSGTSTTFDVSASQVGSTIVLTSALSGDLGNTISLAGSGSTGCPSFNSLTLTGGHTLYWPLTPTGQFTGIVSQQVYASGFYTGMGYGNLTGYAPYLNFVRSFTGIWNLITGNSDFQGSGWTHNNMYDNVPSIGISTFQGVPTSLPLKVLYNNSPLVATTDIALLTISGINFGQTLQLTLTGNY